MQIIRWSLFLFVGLFIVALVDIILDWQSVGGWNIHIVIEMVFGVFSLAIFSGLILFYLKQKQEYEANREELQKSLDKAYEDLSESHQKNKKLMGDFSKILQEQFDTWQLTKSEKEVALLLIKGLSLDEIADVRETKEKTVRQQASNLYKKANLSGRHELVGYFFEDLIL